MPQPALTAFGLSLQSDALPPGAWEARARREEPELRILSATPQAIQDIWSGFAVVGWAGEIDGAPFVVERGVKGDHRFVHGAPPDANGVPAKQTRALHHLAADASVLRCAPSDPTDPSWWRVVLDSALFTVALLRGYEALHAGAIATPDGAIAIAAATGGGKSTLLTELLERGLALMADDVLVLEPRGAQVPLAHPAPPLMTVPATGLPARDDADSRATILSIGDERWIAVPVHPEPMPLKALVVLDASGRIARGRVTAVAEEDREPVGPAAGLADALPSPPRARASAFRAREHDRRERRAVATVGQPEHPPEHPRRHAPGERAVKSSSSMSASSVSAPFSDPPPAVGAGRADPRARGSAPPVEGPQAAGAGQRQPDPTRG